MGGVGAGKTAPCMSTPEAETMSRGANAADPDTILTRDTVTLVEQLLQLAPQR